MKDLINYIQESASYDDAPQKVKDAISTTEPIVKKALEKKGYTIEDSTRDEDFKGIDLKVTNPKTGKLTLIDVKCSDPKNQNTPNFLFTIKSFKGKYYKDKKTDYVAFINFPKNEIVLIDVDNLSLLVNNAKPRRGNGEYVLLNKDEVRKKGYSIIDKDIIKL